MYSQKAGDNMKCFHIFDCKLILMHLLTNLNTTFLLLSLFFLCVYIYMCMYQKQDIYFLTSYILVSSKPLKTETKPKYNFLRNKWMSWMLKCPNYLNVSLNLNNLIIRVLGLNRNLITKYCAYIKIKVPYQQP